VITSAVIIVMNVYMLVIIADTVISYLPQYKNKEWALRLSGLANYSLNPIRRILPPNGMEIDFSPLVVLVALSLIKILW
jgi:uncharacterized protein YggT (Ycf19 family)